MTTEPYDKLVLSPGAPSFRPPLPGIDLPGIFHVRTVPDVRTIREWIEGGTGFLAGMFQYSGIQYVKPTTRAVVVGGGFIGLETAENLVHARVRGDPDPEAAQVLGPLDPEVARLVEEHVKRHGVTLVLGDGVAGFTQLEGGAIEISTLSGEAYRADLVILAIGVRPDTTLAKAAGLEIGERGGIRVDEQMRTSDPDIFAVGDAIEVGTWSPAVEPRRAGRAGEPPGPHRGRRDRRTGLPLPRHPGHLDHRALRRRRGLDRGQREDARSGSVTTTTRRSTSSRTRTPATTPARR